MHVLLAHNDYGKFSGEESAVETIAHVLRSSGHDVHWLRRSSATIGDTFSRKAEAFLSGIYSASARHAMAELLDRQPIDLVQVQNLYPFLSPSILKPCRDRGLPIVMRCPNYRLFCPNGLHLTKGAVCERCLGGREWNCVIHDCAGGRLKSLGYAARNAFARVTGMIVDAVTLFIVQSKFQKARFVAGGIPAERIGILHNIAPAAPPERIGGLGSLVTFVGRPSEEKGIRDFIAAARAMPDIPFAVAGAVDDIADVLASAPPNVSFRGFLKGAELDAFYAETRIFVCPSKWFEGFPNVIVQAMAFAKPVVATRIGAIPEIVDDGVTGVLAIPGDPGDLAAKIRSLWQAPARAQAMGAAGEHKARTAYSAAAFARQLFAIYDEAFRLAGRQLPAT
jgi:glycosyltransferase involved in cell wall biosynthesis